MKISKPLPFLCILLLALPSSCSKFIEQQKKNALMDLITDGDWRVTGYQDNLSNNLTDSFSGYVFKFYDNGTVTGTKPGMQTNGVWSADITKKSITSNFPDAVEPVRLLNYTWTITDSYADSVAARTAVQNGFNILNLHKNE